MTAIRLGDFKLIKNLNTNETRLYNLVDDIGEMNDLTKAMPQESEQLHATLTDYLKAVDAETIEEVFTLTKVAFSQKRKMLSNTIGAFHGGMERLEAASISPDRRPQTLSIEEWISLAGTKDQNE